MKRKPRNLRKAAILLASLDARHVDALLEQLTARQAEVLRRAIERLGEIEPDEQAAVIEEFFRIGPLIPERHSAGLELDDRLPKHLSVSPQNEPAYASPPAGRSTPQFRYLLETPAAALAPFLEREHPQTIAAVVSHLPPQRAAEVLAALATEQQIEVARRLVDLGETDPEILLDVERAVEAWMNSRGRPSGSGNGTVLSQILSAANPHTKQRILATLSRRNAPAERDAPRAAQSPFTFADVQRLDSASLTVVLHHVSGEVLVLALAGASPEFAARVFEMFPASEAAALADALAHLGPTRLSDVEEAQQQMAEMAQQLEARGEIAQLVRRHLSVEV